MRQKITLKPPFPKVSEQDKCSRFLSSNANRSPKEAAKDELAYIRAYETKYGMSSEQFFEKYPDHRVNGLIPEHEWFDWKLCYSTFQKMLKQYNLTLEEING